MLLSSLEFLAGMNINIKGKNKIYHIYLLNFKEKFFSKINIYVFACSNGWQIDKYKECKYKPEL